MPLTQKQIKAIASLKKALNRCHEANLKGGVYDGSFCVWDFKFPDPRDFPPQEFYNKVREHGEVINCNEVRMSLDCGSGT